MNPKPINPGLIPALGFRGQHGRVDLKQDVVEGGAEVCAIDAVVARGFGVVEVLAFGAVEFDERGGGYVVLAGR